MLSDVELTTMTVRPNRTMLPPICVAACDSQSRRNGGLRKTASAPSGSQAPRRRGGVGHEADPPPAGVAVGGASAAVSAGSPRVDEAGEPAFEGRPLEQDVPAAGLAAQADVGPEAVHEPGVAAARMHAAAGARRRRAAGSGRVGPARRQGIRAAADRWPGRGRGPSPARRSARPGSPRRRPPAGSRPAGR